MNPDLYDDIVRCEECGVNFREKKNLDTYLCPKCEEATRIKFCPVCCIKTFRDKEGNCEICLEQRENDRKEEWSEMARLIKEINETVRECAK